ncbi:hypothetical protein Angca_000212, partial [Angiostrongylus cantonensis]
VVGGKACIRDWREEGALKSKKSKAASSRNRVALCWMEENHPDGCPMKDKCYFKH